MKPSKPRPDGGDSNYQVRPHFSKTPGLTPIHDPMLLRHTLAVLRKNGVAQLPHTGPHFAGSKNWTKYAEREKTRLMVVELFEVDKDRWIDMDTDIREVLTRHGFNEPGGEPMYLRYYIFWKDSTDTDSEEELILDQPPRSTRTVDNALRAGYLAVQTPPREPAPIREPWSTRQTDDQSFVTNPFPSSARHRPLSIDPPPMWPLPLTPSRPMRDPHPILAPWTDVSDELRFWGSDDAASRNGRFTPHGGHL